ncbi:SubName: Full=Uncharacterized protein {ECO:0000313/EMBL:CCA72795.1} [Serendipita indica DSM 11827]|nr:SubName: Full=Uncharacterized protein {ECO:0000313/EMBL:CCA72795.1} [Serendipita indica DSM 11827]
MSKPLSLLTISAQTLKLLTNAGYSTVKDLERCTSESLAAELNISQQEAEKVLQCAAVQPRTQANALFPTSQSASTLLANLHVIGIESQTITTLLGGGLRKGQCLEIAGPPGIGKTSLALEFIRSTLHDGFEVLVVDCQSTLHPLRLYETLGSDADKIHHVSTPGYAELFVFMNQLPTYLSSRPSISLIIFSGLSTPFQRLPSHSVRTRLLTLFRTTLAKLGTTCIATVQLSTKLQNPDGTTATFETTGARAVMLPALGDGWYPPQKTYRLLLFYGDQGQRFMRIMATPVVPKDAPGKLLSYSVEASATKNPECALTILRMAAS